MRLWMFILVFMAFAVGVRAETAFVSLMPDVPVMPGMQEIEQDAVVFDKPQGRIVQVWLALEDQAPEAVQQFYHETLPQLGWRRLGDGRFQRENEVLSLDFEDQALRLTIEPL